MSHLNNITNYLSIGNSLHSLYEDPLFALGTVKSLNKETTLLIFDLLTYSTHISNLKNRENIKESIGGLIKMKLISKTNNIVSLNEVFRNSILTGFCLRSYDRKFKKIQYQADISVLDQESKDKFQILLQSIVNRTNERLNSVSEILLFCGLIDETNNITNKGFEFLLQNRKDQNWLIILNSVKYFSRGINDENEMLRDLMEICLKPSPGIYKTEKWSIWFSFLEAVGILNVIETADKSSMFINKKVKVCDDGYIFYLNNANLFDYSSEATKQEKYLILETNFKIYAYTTREYEKSILGLFSKTVYCLPNLIKAYFDEESMCSAFNKGITADQILTYLKEFSDGVPVNLSNQIRIWEENQERIKQYPGVLYNDFLHLSDFIKVLKFVDEKNGLLFKDENRRIIVADEEIHEEVKEFIRTLDS